MATDLSAAALTEAELLHLFLGQRLERGARQEPVDRLLAEFAEYRRELELLRASLREAEASSARGESRPLDLVALFARVDKRLEADGIPE
jgi:hypothetical protein